MVNKVFYIVGLGGFLGSVSRYYTQLFFTRNFPTVFPFGTFTVNVIGCFIIGIVYALFERGNILNEDWRLFLATGLCGGFTTFSSFSHESINLIRDGEFFSLSIYIAASVILGIAATALGMFLFKAA
jgi:fluoride exporter